MSTRPSSSIRSAYGAPRRRLIKMTLYSSFKRKFMPRCRFAPSAEHIAMYEITSPGVMLSLISLNAGSVHVQRARLLWNFRYPIRLNGFIMTRMSSEGLRKVFLVVAGGNASAQRHFEDTIQRTRTVQE